MSGSKAKEVFFPYLFGDIGFQTEFSECRLDGKKVEVKWDETTSECDLAAHESWRSARIKFVVKAVGATQVSELVPSKERKKLNSKVQLIASVHCAKTYKRQSLPVIFDLTTGNGVLELNLSRDDVADVIELRVYAVRTGAQGIDKQYAADAAARLMTSQQVTIRVDRGPTRQGPGLNIEWESFSKSQHKFRSANPQSLFHLDTDGLVLYLNKDCDRDLQAVLSEEAPKGRKATLRNALFAAIAVPVWMTLLRTAASEINEDGTIVPGWQRNVLIQFASAAEPGCDEEEALRRIISDLRDAGGGRAIEQRIPVLIATMVRFRERAEQATKVLS